MRNNSYRDDMRFAEREARWTFFRFLPLGVLALVVLCGIGFGLNSLGLIGRTAVEREVFEQSYQRSTALEERVATEEAALAEIESQLQNPNLDAETRGLLEAQRRAAKVRLDTARRMQQ